MARLCATKRLLNDIVALITHDGDRSALLGLARSDFHLLPCRSIGTLSDLVKPGLSAVVATMGEGLLEDVALLAKLEACGARVVLRSPLTVLGIGELTAIASRMPWVAFSLRTALKADDWTSLLDSIANPDAGPAAQVLCEVASGVPAEAHCLVVAALAFGSVRLSGATLAASCGMALRTAQVCLQRNNAPGPRRLLLWGQAFWMAWRLRRWGMSCKQAAICGGFGRTSAMSSAIRPLTGFTPAAFRDIAGWDLLIRSFRKELVAPEWGCDAKTS